MTTLFTGTVTASGTSASSDWSAHSSSLFVLHVDNPALLSTDTLDVYLQHTLDDSTWNDFVHFTQVLGNGGAKNLAARWSALGSPVTTIGAFTDGSMAAGVQQGVIGPTIRVKYVVASLTTPSFTFSVTGRNVRN